MAASGSGGNNLMTYHEFVAAEQQQAAEGKTKSILRNKHHSTLIGSGIIFCRISFELFSFDFCHHCIHQVLSHREIMSRYVSSVI